MNYFNQFIYFFVQIFHCLHHEGTGGATLLVDGFHCVTQLLEANAVSFKHLCQRDIRHQYIETGLHHTISLAPIIKLCTGTGELMCLRYNQYDRAPICTIPQESIGKYFASLQLLSQIIEDKNNEYWIKLNPGTILFIDNWRVMHGRAAFTGKRTVTGCYLPRDDWLSKARMLQVI